METTGTMSHVWHEQSAIWEIIAGEIVVQHKSPVAEDREALIRLARKRALDAHERLRSGDLDSAGHALIGCSIALGLASRTESEARVPIDYFGADLGASVSWASGEPSHEDLDLLLKAVDRRVEGAPFAQTLWELAVTAGSAAGGLSPHITRRRRRRDTLATPV